MTKAYKDEIGKYNFYKKVHWEYSKVDISFGVKIDGKVYFYRLSSAKERALLEYITLNSKRG
jgi:hypothetical protein